MASLRSTIKKAKKMIRSFRNSSNSRGGMSTNDLARALSSGGQSKAPSLSSLASGTGLSSGYSSSGKRLFTPSNQSVAPTMTDIGSQISKGTDSAGNRLYTSSGGSSSGGGSSSSPAQETRLNDYDSRGLASSYGLSGIADNKFTGLTSEEANREAQEYRNNLLAETSGNTSFAYTPEAVSGAKKDINDVRLKVKDINDYPYSTTKTKEDQTRSLIDSTAINLASKFNTTEEFNDALNGNPEMARLMQEYEGLGGSISDVAAKIGQTPGPSNNVQTVDQYLSYTPEGAAEKQALDSLVPEKSIYQQQIALEQSIPQQYAEQYFGTEEQVGRQRQLQEEAKQLSKQLKRQADDAEDNIRAQAKLALDINNAEAARAKAQIEENRLNSKNYMTGMLAKLGALNTTGAAVKGLANLEQKYEAQAMETAQDYAFEARSINNKLNEGIDDIDNSLADALLDIQSDLSKNEDDMVMEIMKMQQKADKETLKIAERYAQEFRTQTEKYRKKLEANAKSYTNSFASIVSNYGEGDFLSSKITGKNIESGYIDAQGNFVEQYTTPSEERRIQDIGLSGGDSIKYFLATEDAFQEWIVRGKQTGDISERNLSLKDLKTLYDKWKTSKKSKDEISLSEVDLGGE